MQPTNAQREMEPEEDDAPTSEGALDRCGNEHGGVRCTLPRGHDGRHMWRTEHSYVSWR